MLARLLAIPSTAVVVLTLTCSAHAGSWQPSRVIGQGAYGEGPRLLAGPGTRIAATWERIASRSTVVSVVALADDAGGAFGAPVDVTGDEAPGATAQTGFAPDDVPEITQVVGRDVTTGRLGDPSTTIDRDVTPPIAPTVVTGADGTAVYAAATGPAAGNFHIRVAVRPPDGAWTTPTELEPYGGVIPVTPAVGIDAHGNATVAWVESQAGGDGLSVVTAYRPAGGDWQPIARHSVPGALNAGRVAMAVLADGRTTIVVGTNERSAVLDGRDGGFGEVALLPLPGGFSDIRLATDDAGDAAIAWYAPIAFNSRRLAVVTRRAGGAFDAPRMVGGCGAFSGGLAMGPDGSVVAALVQHPSDGDHAGGAVLAARMTPDGDWSAPEPVSAPGEQPQWPTVAIDRDGRAIVGYSTGSGDVRVAPSTAPLAAIGPGPPLDESDVTGCDPGPPPYVPPSAPGQLPPRLTVRATLDRRHRVVVATVGCPRRRQQACAGTLTLRRGRPRAGLTAVALASGATRRYRLRVPRDLSLRRLTLTARSGSVVVRRRVTSPRA